MLQVANHADRRVIRLHRSSCAEGGLYQTGRACSRASRATGRAAGSRTRCAGPEATHTTARRASHDSRVNAAERSACLGSLNVGVGDGQVISSDRQVEIVLQRQGDRVLQRDIQLAIMYEAFNAGRIVQLRRWHLARSVGVERVMRMGNRQPSGSVYGELGPCRRLGTHQQTTQEKHQNRRLEQAFPHVQTASPLCVSAEFEVSPTSHPSRIWIDRVPYDALRSECVTCMIVVPSRFNALNNSMISLAWLECRLPVGSSASSSAGLWMTARAMPTNCCCPPESWLGRSEERRVGKE